MERDQSLAAIFRLPHQDLRNLKVQISDLQTYHGRELGSGQSWTKDRQAFEHRHVGDWVVVSAIYSSHHADMTEVVATRGGARDQRADERRFLVPSAEYATRGPFGFVIDEQRHVLHRLAAEDRDMNRSVRGCSLPAWRWRGAKRAITSIIHRQIATRAERLAVTEKAKARNRTHKRSGSRWTRSDEMLFQDHVDRLSFERRSELDAVTRKVERQDRAITTYG